VRKRTSWADDAADTLIEDASTLGRAGCTDSATLRAIDEHGNLVGASFPRISHFERVCCFGLMHLAVPFASKTPHEVQ